MLSMTAIEICECEDTPVARRSVMTWAQRLKRVFRIDVETCQDCGGQAGLRLVASTGHSGECCEGLSNCCHLRSAITPPGRKHYLSDLPGRDW